MNPGPRIRVVRPDAPRADGDHVLYWMTGARRLRHNHSLDRALELAREHRLPLRILETLPSESPWASRRTHAFVLEGMRGHSERLARLGISYHPFVEREAGESSRLASELSATARVVVADRTPDATLARRLKEFCERSECRVEQIDANGLVPVDLTERAFPTAHSFRRWIQRHLPRLLDGAPEADPLLGSRKYPTAPSVPGIVERWPALRDFGIDRALKGVSLPMDVAPADLTGGEAAASERLESFLARSLDRYEDRNQPEAEATSLLSPHLHFGQISPWEIFARIAEREDWDPGRLSKKTDGSRQGWWGMSAAAEGFLDQLVTWRELGLNAARWMPGYDTYDSLPDWARATLEEHAGDPRPHLYSLEEFEAAATHDPLWNAAQTQLVREGLMHNYLRMLWGKKILHWSASPEDAARIMVHLNNKYALDGCDPNSYSGIFWVLGRYDRAWGPEREVFGKIRYMSSANTARKVRVKDYLARYAPGGPA